jgi:hypothetical protein
MYEIHKLNNETHIYHSEVGVIPEDSENRHYAEYLEWVAKGNTAKEVNVSYETPSPA